MHFIFYKNFLKSNMKLYKKIKNEINYPDKVSKNMYVDNQDILIFLKNYKIFYNYKFKPFFFYISENDMQNYEFLIKNLKFYFRNNYEKRIFHNYLKKFFVKYYDFLFQYFFLFDNSGTNKYYSLYDNILFQFHFYFLVLMLEGFLLDMRSHMYTFFFRKRLPNELFKTMYDMDAFGSTNLLLLIRFRFLEEEFFFFYDLFEQDRLTLMTICIPLERKPFNLLHYSKFFIIYFFLSKMFSVYSIFSIPIKKYLMILIKYFFNRNEKKE